MLPDIEEIARQLINHDRRLQHLERLETALTSGEGARVFNDANLVIPNAVVTTLTYNSESYDTDNIHSVILNPSRLTCRTPGIYAIAFAHQWEWNVNGTRDQWMLLNGITRIDRFEQVAMSSTSQFGYMQYELAVGDFIEIQVLQTSGGNLSMWAASDYIPIFCMYWLGPPT
jgi:hypothetical protein